jgi:hypothetical protein
MRKGLLVLVVGLLAVLGFTASTAGGQTASAANHKVVVITKTVTLDASTQKITGYAFNQVWAIANEVNADIAVQAYTTINNAHTQIWLNGAVKCLNPYGGSITWCGLGGGNGTYVLNVGMNYQKYGTDGTLYKYYLRMVLDASAACWYQGSMNGYYSIFCRT